MPKLPSVYRCKKCREFWGLQLFNLSKGICYECEESTDSDYKWSEDSPVIIDEDEDA